MSNDETMYKEFPLYNDMTNVSHRAWNRLQIINNLKTAERPRDAANYLNKLSKEDKLAIGLLLMAIKKKGLDKVRSEINRDIEVGE